MRTCGNICCKLCVNLFSHVEYFSGGHSQQKSPHSRAFGGGRRLGKGSSRLACKAWKPAVCHCAVLRPICSLTTWPPSPYLSVRGPDLYQCQPAKAVQCLSVNWCLSMLHVRPKPRCRQLAEPILKAWNSHTDVPGQPGLKGVPDSTGKILAEEGR